MRPTSKLVAAQSVAHDQAIANDCYSNTMEFIRRNGEQFVMASGWLIGDYVNEVGTALIPHYWVVNSATNMHLDPTPLVADDKFEYVFDYGIATVGLEYKCAVPLPLLIRQNGDFKVRLKADEYIDFDDFDLNYLFQLTKNGQ